MSGTHKLKTMIGKIIDIIISIIAVTIGTIPMILGTIISITALTIGIIPKISILIGYIMNSTFFWDLGRSLVGFIAKWETKIIAYIDSIFTKNSNK